MCDIVMKGGITSGVVYPGAILSLAQRYRFRSIGGTSAGAIAAAILGAAEHARQVTGEGGFDEIADLPEKLGKEGLMLQLFQADRSTRPLFEAATAIMARRWLRGLWRLLAAFRRPAIVAGVVLLGSILLSAVGDADWAFGVGGIAAAFAIFAVGVVGELLRVLRAITANDFGVCRLGPAVGTPAKPALTDWLHQRIQAAAMRSKDAAPLTFADLWGASAATPGPASGDAQRLASLMHLSRAPECRRVDLQMITTDLTQGRPLRLPVAYDQHRPELEDGADALLFDRFELRRYFPPDVVRHLVTCAEPLDEAARAITVEFESTLFDPGSLEPALRGADWEVEGRRERLLRLPIGPDLPVLVATRMSLSFPILISTVPLWRLVPDDAGTFLVQRVRFSDGGITSNFPIHFFDSPLPRWPTFALNLSSPRPGEVMDVDDARACVERPPAPGDPARDHMRDIDGLTGFVVALKDAAQNWRDNSQARLPGFRDRVSHIKLAKGEGGLNLTMEVPVIKRLNARGAVAGDDLREMFSGTTKTPQPTSHWDDHRFARYRVTMAVMQRLLRSYERGWTGLPDTITRTYADRVVAGQDTAPFEFASEKRRKAATATSEAYAGLGVSGGLLDDDNVPRPSATMRTVPPA